MRKKSTLRRFAALGMSAALVLVVAPVSAALVAMESEPAAAAGAAGGATVDLWGTLWTWFSPWVPIGAADIAGDDGTTGSSDTDRGPSMDPDGLTGEGERGPSMDPDG